MKLYQLKHGNIEKYIVAKDKDHAYEIGTDPKEHPDLHFRPFSITEITVPGWVIKCEPESEGNIEKETENSSTVVEEENPEFEAMNRDELKEWLDVNGVDYVPQWGEKKLREAAIKSLSK